MYRKNKDGLGLKSKQPKHGEDYRKLERFARMKAGSKNREIAERFLQFLVERVQMGYAGYDGQDLSNAGFDGSEKNLISKMFLGRWGAGLVQHQQILEHEKTRQNKSRGDKYHQSKFQLVKSNKKPVEYPLQGYKFYQFWRLLTNAAQQPMEVI